jgi:hypothetical protein
MPLFYYARRLANASRVCPAAPVRSGPIRPAPLRSSPSLPLRPSRPDLPPPFASASFPSYPQLPLHCRPLLCLPLLSSPVHLTPLPSSPSVPAIAHHSMPVRSNAFPACPFHASRFIGNSLLALDLFHFIEHAGKLFQCSVFLLKILHRLQRVVEQLRPQILVG